MNTSASNTTAPTIRDYLRVLRRFRVTIIVAVALSLTAAALYTAREEPRHAASAEVLVGLADAPRNATQRVTPERINATQVALAQTPEVAERALSEVGVTDRTPKEYLESVKVAANAQNDVLTFTASDTNPSRAIRLATEHARQFILYRRDIDGGAYVDQVGDAFLIAAADRATQTGPKLPRNLMMGLAMGLILGVLLAFMREALDTRVRSVGEIVGRLGLPLLGRLPETSRKLRRKGQLVMLAEPNGADAEPIRMLRTNLMLLNAESGARTIMVTSAAPEDGKSVATANLAVALARMGRKVILVDLDIRRPSLARRFALDQREPGLTEALLGQVSLDAALAPVPMDAGSGRHDGSLQLLPAGAAPADLGEFFTSLRIHDLLAALKQRADFVLIDGPPLLGTSDGMTLAAEVDALAVVARANDTRRPELEELRQVLAMLKAGKLGVIVTGTGADASYPEPAVHAPLEPATPLELEQPGNGVAYFNSR